MHKHNISLIAGPLAFLILLFLPLGMEMPPSARAAAAITLWMTIWWIAEPVPVSVTALLPLVLFPLTGVAPLKTISHEFGNEIIFLFMGGMFFGQAIEKWNLHQRIALTMVLKVGKNPSRVVLGFMAATALISMWISNTATAVMMTPVAIAVSRGAWGEGEEQGTVNFRKALMLGVAYACSIGGLATIIGTPTNAIFVGFVEQKMEITISFWRWFLVGFPLAAVLLVLCWLLLIWLFPLPKKQLSENQLGVLKRNLSDLGPLAGPEKRLLILFSIVILAWVTGSLFWYQWIPNTNDTIVALIGALLMFVVPAEKGSPMPLLSWESALRIPWGVLLFFGGGLALAKGFDSSGLATWVGAQLEGLSGLSSILILLIVLTVVVALSEIASNIATASMMMPVLAALAAGIGLHPFGLLLSAAMAASIGFGLPIATAPNAIVFSSGHLSPRDMARAGFLLDIISILLLLFFVYTLFPAVWGLEM